MSFLDKPKQVRCTPDTDQRILAIVSSKFDGNGCPKYDSQSHFIRCAILHLLKHEEEELKRVK